MQRLKTHKQSHDKQSKYGEEGDFILSLSLVSLSVCISQPFYLALTLSSVGLYSLISGPVKFTARMAFDSVRGGLYSAETGKAVWRISYAEHVRQGHRSHKQLKAARPYWNVLSNFLPRSYYYM